MTTNTVQLYSHFQILNTRGPCCTSQPHSVKPGFDHFGPKGAQTTCSELDPDNKIPCTQSAHCLPDNMAITVLAIAAGHSKQHLQYWRAKAAQQPLTENT